MNNTHHDYTPSDNTPISLAHQNAGEQSLQAALTEPDEEQAKEQAFQKLLRDFTVNERWRQLWSVASVGFLQIIGICLLPFIFWMVEGYAGRSITSRGWLAFSAFWVLIVIGSLAAFRLSTLPSRKQNTLLEKLASSEDVRAIGALLSRGLMIKNKATLQTVVTALISLLSRVTENDASRMSARDLKILNGLLLAQSVLSYYKNTVGAAWDDLLIALLHAVGEVSVPYTKNVDAYLSIFRR